ncbi:Tll0287-like domain-containing protein [Anditalea andensis]|uniref:Cytochrome C n=1 Tax=Anditalea andensis TaxID=1048983 RepID=A0A074LIQ8_9BACT|nr:DUF3365 domain-containing protein [Anditalea andensis]KEO73657.1 cytochrome C [Anditalea andensis]
MKSISYTYFLLCLPILFSCNTEERVSREVFDNVKRESAVKRISEVQIVEKALAMGNEISDEAQEQLMSTLQNAIEENGLVGALNFCQAEALPIVKSTGSDYGVEIRRVSNRFRNPADQPKADEEVLLGAYEYNHEAGIASEPNIQKLQNGEVLLYTRAITIPGQLCLNCHGDISTDVPADVADTIDQLYPEDKAKGHKVGELRGMWAIRIPRKEVISRL